MDFQEMTVIEENAAVEGPQRRESGKRGRKPGRKSADKIDMKAKLERSRQSARECRARKKLRYQYLEELVADREKAVFALRKELERYVQIARDIDEGKIPENIHALLEGSTSHLELKQHSM
ncbi:REPTOR-binding partner [Sitophilus oryzae]|uniref:REPTOR-binding partner n=1 Tax=Sitophilus oryzae TaxID=7048 RepID=A0A6J2XXE2_SITOR|nr:REPTOR-binding partner [Sitophilus oryzae]